MDTWQQKAYNKQLAWLTTMANNPGFKDHAEHMARLMDKAPSGLFAGIAQDLEACMKKLQDVQQPTGD